MFNWRWSRLLCEGHILLEDVPGIGKTTMAKALARSLDCSFRRIQFTPDLMPSDVTGINYYNQKLGEFVFREGPLVAQVVLADEINRATPRTQAALLEAMEERQLTVEGVTTALPRPFLVMATQNPVELEGTFPLPGGAARPFSRTTPTWATRTRTGRTKSSRDSSRRTRSTMCGRWSMPRNSCGSRRSLNTLHVDPAVRRYAVQVVRATRTDGAFELGASPRASLALVPEPPGRMQRSAGATSCCQTT